MRPTAPKPLVSKSWWIVLLIGLVFVTVGYGLRYEIESTSASSGSSWPDLALFLCAYLFAFCLKPIQKVILRKLCHRAAQRTHHKTAR